MGTAKEVFLKDKELADKWRGWVHGPDFAKILAFTDAEFVNQQELNMDMLRGARAIKNILLSLADIESEEGGFPSTGLDHNLDPKPRTKESVQPKK